MVPFKSLDTVIGIL